MTVTGGYLLTYFSTEPSDGEQVRFAVSDGPRPDRFTALGGGKPILTSDVGEQGARDPFIVREPDGSGFTLLATDLRVQDDGDWQRAINHGSRGIVVWQSPDLLGWSRPRLLEVAPPGAGNAWAPKAFRVGDEWLVFWASALPPDGYQRIFVSRTSDWCAFSSPIPYLDLGHHVIDVAFARAGDDVFRFSADQKVGRHIHVERGRDLFDDGFVAGPSAGSPELDAGEGPAVTVTSDGEVFLLIDEFAGRGYQLFVSDDPMSGFRHVPDAVLPAGARHGSLLSITLEEKAALMSRFGG